MKLVILASLLASTALTHASPTPLHATGGTIVAEPDLRFAVAKSGTTAQARYRSADPGWYPTNEPLVLFVRGANLEVPDQAKLIRAEISGNDIVLTVETRHFTGPHACTMCLPPMAPLLEVQLGTLVRGDYRVVVEHVELDYADENHPERATKGRTWQDSRSFFVTSAPAPQPRSP
ncbi:hypothetical protein BH11MYX1_BH11MYX1_52650 [soil metagenome]